jgi:hypothetical protein
MAVDEGFILVTAWSIPQNAPTKYQNKCNISNNNSNTLVTTTALKVPFKQFNFTLHFCIFSDLKYAAPLFENYYKVHSWVNWVIYSLQHFIPTVIRILIIIA